MEPLAREVCASADEFVRGLEQAFPGAVTGGSLRYAVAFEGAAMEIDLKPGPDRILAQLRLPTLAVRIRFTAGKPEACRRLIERMDRAMHRGGG